MRPLLLATWLVLVGSLPSIVRADEPSRGALIEPGTTVTLTPEPEVGACVGGACGPARALERAEARPRSRVGNFALSGAVLGTASAGVSLASSLAIALAESRDERLTRGLWLGHVAVTTPLVALSSWLARRDTRFAGYKGLRRAGWLAYGAALSNGILQWYGAFHELRTPAGLTIASGCLGALALLPHALEALVAARKVRSRRFAVTASALGAALRF